MWQSEKQIQTNLGLELKSLKNEIKILKESEITQDKANQWWKDIDLTDKFLINLFSKMYGSANQRILQLYIVRDNLNLKKKIMKKK